MTITSTSQHLGSGGNSSTLLVDWGTTKHCMDSKLISGLETVMSPWCRRLQHPGGAKGDHRSWRTDSAGHAQGNVLPRYSVTDKDGGDKAVRLPCDLVPWPRTSCLSSTKASRRCIKTARWRWVEHSDEGEYPPLVTPPLSTTNCPRTWDCAPSSSIYGP